MWTKLRTPSSIPNHDNQIHKKKMIVKVESLTGTPDHLINKKRN